MKLKTDSIKWNDVAAVSKALQPWLKSSPSRQELAKVAPLLFKNEVLVQCARTAQLNDVIQGMSRLVLYRTHSVAIKCVTDLIQIAEALAPFHEAMKDPSYSEPDLYKRLKDLADGVLVSLSEVSSDKHDLQVAYEKKVCPLTNTTTYTLYHSSTEDALTDRLAEFFTHIDKQYQVVIRSIKEQKAMATAVPEKQVYVNPQRQVVPRALAHAL